MKVKIILNNCLYTFWSTARSQCLLSHTTTPISQTQTNLLIKWEKEERLWNCCKTGCCGEQDTPPRTAWTNSLSQRAEGWSRGQMKGMRDTNQKGSSNSNILGGCAWLHFITERNLCANDDRLYEMSCAPVRTTWSEHIYLLVKSSLISFNGKTVYCKRKNVLWIIGI